MGNRYFDTTLPHCAGSALLHVMTSAMDTGQHRLAPLTTDLAVSLSFYSQEKLGRTSCGNRPRNTLAKVVGKAGYM